MELTPLVFTGISDFSNDFQTILDRAQQIAQIPVRQLQNRDTDVLSKKTLLSNLSSGIVSLSSSLASLGSTAANRALSATSSDSSKVTVSNTGATLATTYTINPITSAASAASERTTTGYADTNATPVSTTGTVKLKVGSYENTFSLDTNTLVGLRDKINSLGAGVTATILTLSGGSYLSITANATGATTLQLLDDPDGANTSLLTSASQGTNAAFKLNGIDIVQAGNVVNSAIPGVTFTIVAASGSPVTLTLATDRPKLASALQDFVTNYNALRSQVNAQSGLAAGLLSGSGVVSQVGNTLRQIASYRTSTGSVKGLADLGVVFNASGEAKFDSTIFNSLSDVAIDDGFNFIGSATTGLGAYADKLNQIGDPLTGLIKVEQEGLDRVDKNLQTQISLLNERITISQNALAAKLHAADALLGTLKSQQQTLTASIESLNLTLYGRRSSA